MALGDGCPYGIVRESACNGALPGVQRYATFWQTRARVALRAPPAGLVAQLAALAEMDAAVDPRLAAAARLLGGL